ncbi:immunity repressor [Gordonia phage Easley]|uniref:Immunity repressor n=1 Tax=Gordonia phage Easley TaxID=2182395 RepID=A0A2U8UN34_9CAUD|nr:transcriptional repressor [Gordonia phage Easley]AWN05065.1 immunity repressor [Gordonia phage Easley]
MNATSLRDLLQQAVDRRNAEGRDASFRALQEAVEAEESTRPRGLSLNRTTASQILRGTYKGEPSDGTIRAIGWLAGVGDEDAFAAAGRRSPGLPFAEELPPGVDDLSPKERRAAIEMLRTLVAQRREINRYVDSSTGTQEPRAPREANPRKKTLGKVTALPQREQVDEVEKPAAARLGQGKTKGEQLRDRDAQLGEESQVAPDEED